MSSHASQTSVRDGLEVRTDGRTLRPGDETDLLRASVSRNPAAAGRRKIKGEDCDSGGGAARGGETGERERERGGTEIEADGS